MTKQQVEQKIRAFLALDTFFDSAKITVAFRQKSKNKQEKKQKNER